VPRNARNVTHIALITAFGLVIFLVESLLPRPLPWAKPGLANMATLLAIYLFDTKTALLVVVVRVFAGTLILGSFASPSFVLSISGGVCSALLMGFLRIIAKNHLSVVGVSICGAICHNFVQLYMAYLLIVKNSQIFYLLPMLMVPAVFTGLLVGVVTLLILKQVEITGWRTPHWYGPIDPFDKK